MEFLINKTEVYEDMALKLGDLNTAIKLNWLKNSMKYGDINEDRAFLRLLEITVTGN